MQSHIKHINLTNTIPVGIQCPALNEPEHSFANYLGTVPNPDYPIGTIAVSLCEQGYRMVEGDLLRTCSSDGTWIGEDTVCVGE